jgi:hypothetical protein
MPELELMFCKPSSFAVNTPKAPAAGKENVKIPAKIQDNIF